MITLIVPRRILNPDPNPNPAGFTTRLSSASAAAFFFAELLASSLRSFAAAAWQSVGSCHVFDSGYIFLFYHQKTSSNCSMGGIHTRIDILQPNPHTTTHRCFNAPIKL